MCMSAGTVGGQKRAPDGAGVTCGCEIPYIDSGSWT